MPEQCDECGFDGEHYDREQLLTALDALGPQWRAALATAGDRLRMRPAPTVWSPLEYAAHSRDVTLLHGFGVEEALTGNETVLPPVADDLADQAATNYNTEDPATVLDALEVAASKLATLGRGADSWTSGITIGDNRSDVRALLEHALHDSTHHLLDIERGLAQS
jgi:hypothetical protein